MEPQRPAKHWPYAFIATLAASAFAYFFGLGRLGLLGPDEPRYAEVAREMFASGDYISTRLCGCLWFEKPALLYWMSAAGYHVFGVGELGARAGTAAAALATVALVYCALRRLGLASLGLAASLVLATSGIFIAYARVATPDMIFTVMIAAALFAGYGATKTSGGRRLMSWALCFAFMGLAVLAKGLAGIVLVLAVLVLYLLLTRQLSSVRLRDCLIGLVAFAAVAGSWYIPVTLRHGWPFIEEFFIRHHFERYTSNEFGHPQPFYFFLPVAIAGVLPWTFFLIPAAARLRSLKPRESMQGSLLTLAWLWVAVPLVFFSFSESKLPGYILPVVPALALIVGAEIERLCRGDRSTLLKAAAWVTALTLVIMSIAFVVYMRRESVDTGWRGTLEWLPLAIALVAVVMLAVSRTREFVTGAAAVVMSLILAAVILLFPKLGDEVSLKALSLEAGAALRPGEKIGFYLKKEFAAVFYAEGRVLCEPRRGGTFYALHQNMLADALEQEPSLIMITDAHWRQGLENDRRFTTEYIAAQGDALAIRVTLKKEK